MTDIVRIPPNILTEMYAFIPEHFNKEDFNLIFTNESAEIEIDTIYKYVPMYVISYKANPSYRFCFSKLNPKKEYPSNATVVNHEQLTGVRWKYFPTKCDNYFHGMNVKFDVLPSVFHSWLNDLHSYLTSLNEAKGETNKEQPIKDDSDAMVNIDRLKIILTSASTDGGIDDNSDAEYKILRKELLSDQSLKHLTPKEVKNCSTLKEFRSEMQTKGGYQERRLYIKNIFAPLINKEFESDADTIDDIASSVDFGSIKLLTPDLVDKGRKMAEVYLYLYGVENSLREFIRTVNEKNPIKIPKDVQKKIDGMKDKAAQRKYLPVRGDNDLYFCDFVELGQIMNSNWEIFKSYFPGQSEHWIKVKIDELYQVRCLVSHNSFVDDDAIQLLKANYKSVIAQIKIE